MVASRATRVARKGIETALEVYWRLRLEICDVKEDDAFGQPLFSCWFFLIALHSFRQPLSMKKMTRRLTKLTKTTQGAPKAPAVATRETTGLTPFSSARKVCSMVGCLAKDPEM